MTRIVNILTSLLLCAFAAYGYDAKELISANGFKSSVEPMLTTHWSQDGGENCLLPIFENGERAKAGCGVVALAQLMNYWKYPNNGDGVNYYIWERGYKDYELRYADFKENDYQWAETASVYKNNEYVTDCQLEIIGRIMHHLGVALEVKYDDYYGTPTSIEAIHTVLKRFFKYNPNSEIKRQSSGYSQEEWLKMIYKELSEGRPIIMGGNWHGVNHIYVADGYDENGLVHLNMGHADINNPNHDKYYDIFSQETYTDDMRMIIGISPEELNPVTEEVSVSPGMSLLDCLSRNVDYRQVSRLKIHGEITPEDLELLRDMASTFTGQLSYLDMSDCEISSNELPDSAFYNVESGAYTLQEIVLPKNLERIGDKCFMNCVGLYNVTFSSDVKEIGNYAFSSCRYLKEFTLPRSVDKIGANPFRYDKLFSFNVDENNTRYKMQDEIFLMSKDDKTVYSAFMYPSDTADIPKGTTFVYSQTFIKSPLLKTVILPETVNRLGRWAFAYCYFLDDIYSYPTEAPTLSDDTFLNTNPNLVVHIPIGSKESYIAQGWDEYVSIVEDLPSGVDAVNSNNPEIVKIFSIMGFEVKTTQKGNTYIVVYSNGDTKKVLRNHKK